ncbi:L-serine ammonia-lyase, iron-sulfur-dependent, subunit alpha [Clostridiisalibacter paucivorans]|uniref:L-serine ammonia-lyase, iron-sulfur-dependent, subunit alpha n=1 Tax=Clostridiisalibacter paucivorans TaxID=408753 RepID=UPI00047DEAC1|nr:L-serine ammonia-lyase, iron-sulfur-dependent, subunit alpha [Clostridiisalibacter paucivorans]
MFANGKELLQFTRDRNISISEAILIQEAKEQDTTPEKIKQRMQSNLDVMINSSKKALDKKIDSIGGIIGGDAKKVKEYSQNNATLCGKTINMAMAMAFSCSEVNASMGKICAAPTAGSCGIIPSAIITVGEKLNLSKEEMVNGLLTSAGIGQIIARNATLSGAEGGCQAECGSAAAMAAAALTELSGGTPQMALHSASIALKNIMGLICDPIAGLVEAPCAKRNASGVINAMISADLALAGVESIIPFDEVVNAMYKVGKSLPVTLRETALGGVAATETGVKIKNKILG